LANNFLLLKELSSSNIDAIILESPQASEFITQYNNLNRFDLSDTKSSLSMVFLKNSGLRQKINDVILKLQNDGYIDGLAKKWFINITN
jgi:ABC-type amino acid transport substrate-binding protein